MSHCYEVAEAGLKPRCSDSEFSVFPPTQAPRGCHPEIWDSYSKARYLPRMKLSLLGTQSHYGAQESTENLVGRPVRPTLWNPGS